MQATTQQSTSAGRPKGRPAVWALCSLTKGHRAPVGVVCGVCVRGVCVRRDDKSSRGTPIALALSRQTRTWSFWSVQFPGCATAFFQAPIHLAALRICSALVCTYMRQPSSTPAYFDVPLYRQSRSINFAIVVRSDLPDGTAYLPYRSFTNQASRGTIVVKVHIQQGKNVGVIKSRTPCMHAHRICLFKIARTHALSDGPMGRACCRLQNRRPCAGPHTHLNSFAK